MHTVLLQSNGYGWNRPDTIHSKHSKLKSWSVIFLSCQRALPVCVATHSTPCVNTLRRGQNGRHFADDNFKCVFLSEDMWISMNISLKFVPQYSSIASDNGLAPIRRQAIIWINDGKFTDSYMRHSYVVMNTTQLTCWILSSRKFLRLA